MKRTMILPFVVLLACKGQQRTVDPAGTEQEPARPAWVNARPVVASDYTGIGMCPKAESDAPPISTRDVSVL